MVADSEMATDDSNVGVYWLVLVYYRASLGTAMVDNRLQALVAPIDIDGSLAESIDSSADKMGWSLDILGALELHSNHLHILQTVVA